MFSVNYNKSYMMRVRRVHPSVLHGGSGAKYWDLVGPVWTKIDIYAGPEVFRTTFDGAPRAAALLFAAHFCQSEVCNGGFLQFFWNSTGVLAPEAVEGMKAIGCHKLAAVIKTAMDRLAVPYVRERTARQQLVDALPKRHFDPEDQHFYRLLETDNGGFEAAANRFSSQTDIS